MEPGQKCDVIVNQPFMVNEIKFNANLNKRFQEALSYSKSPENYLNALTVDFDYNQRQFTIYIINCTLLKCQAEDLQGLVSLTNK